MNEISADASHSMYAVCTLYQKAATVYHTWLTRKWEVVTGDTHRFGHCTYLATWLSMNDAMTVGEDMFPHLPPWTFLRWTCSNLTGTLLSNHVATGVNFIFISTMSSFSLLPQPTTSY